MADILHMITIAAGPSAVYAALTEQRGLAGWWTQEVEAKAEVGSIARFRFGEQGGSDMEIRALAKDRRVHWHCVAHLSGGEWLGTELFFDLEHEVGSTRLRFSQRRWLMESDMLRYCSTKWAMYLLSLKQLLEGGKGHPWPHDIPI